MNPESYSKEEIRSIILRGEDSTIEFKESANEGMIHTLAAFANGYGGFPKGVTLVGINSIGSVVGLKENPDEIQRKITDHCRSNCQPPVAPTLFIREYESLKILIIEVKRSESRPHRVNGICYIRIGSTTRKATSDEEYSVREEIYFRPFDDRLVLDADSNDLEDSKIINYFRTTRSQDVTLQDERIPKVLAEHLGFLRKEGGRLSPTISSILMFGKNTQHFLPHSSVNAIRFRGTTVADQILDRKEIKGTSDELIDQSRKFVDRFSTVGNVITSQSRRIDIVEYPGLAVRECIANAIVHRDYQDTGRQIDLYMFDDRIEIRSPGSLGGGLTREDLIKMTGKRYLRNPTLAGILYELRYIEKAGTGIPRTFKVMEENGSPKPEILVDSNSFVVILPANTDYSARRKFEEGLLAKDRGEIEKARALFDEATKIKSDYSEAYAAWASLEGEIGSLERARELYKISVEKNPLNSVAFLNWAILEERQGHNQDARKLFDESVRANPNNSVALHTWATMERRLGNFPKAQELFRRATELEPQNSINWQAWGQLEFRCKRYDEAERLLTTALNYSLDDRIKAWICCDLARTLDQLRRPKNEVESRYKMSIELNPNSGQTYHYYADFLKKMGRESEARNMELNAQRFGWKDPQNEVTRGYRSHKMGRSSCYRSGRRT